MRVEFILNTTGEHFAGWVHIHTIRDGRDGKLKLPTEDGWIVLQHALSPFSSSPRPSISQGFIMPMYITQVMQSGELREDIIRLPTTIGILFTVVPLTPDRIQVTADRHHSAAIDYFKQLLAEIEKLWPEAKARRERPPEPAEPAPLDVWFDYYEAMKKGGFKITLADIAEKTGYAAGYVRRLKSEYNARMRNQTDDSSS